MDYLFKEQQAYKLTHPAMGTVMTHQSYGADSEDCLATIGMEIERLEALFSRFRPGSDISRINQAAGANKVTISEESMLVLKTAQEFARLYPQCFDISITPLVDLWRNNAASHLVPDDAQIDAALALVNHEDLLLNAFQVTAGLRRMGQSIDLGGIAKGYAADRLLDVYRVFGIHSAFSNLGGNVIAVGCKPDGSAWKIGIQHPRCEGSLLGAVSIENQAVVTSGDYQRYFMGSDGRRYHHILDSKTGYPSQSDLISVTIVTSDAMKADALSTILFIAGLEKGLEIISKFPECDAILVDQNGQMLITKGLHEKFQSFGNEKYTFVSP